MDVLCRRQERVWICSGMGDHICEMKSQERRGFEPEIIFAVLQPLVNPAPNMNQTQKTTCLVLGTPYRCLL